MSARATRLESLFLLVRDGSCAQIRENAAEKLGEVAVCAPDACASILQKLRPLIVDKEWEIRVAASKCIGVVGCSLRNEDENVADVFASVSLGGHDSSSNALSLQTVDIQKVVQEGAPLLRSGGEEYNYKTDLSDQERRVYAIKQRRLLLKRLSGTERPIWKSHENSLTQQLLPRLNRDHAQEIANEIEASEAMPDMKEDPARIASQKKASELLYLSTRIKRQSNNHLAAKGGVKRLKPGCHGGEPNNVSIEYASESSTGGWIGESKVPSVATIVAGLVSDLFESMFDSNWEVRHGALLSLRQILLSAHFITAVEAARALADNSGKCDFVDKWLEECLVRCICVLALDQFVDYSADGSVSPVREVCAQVFGILLGSLSSEATLVKYLQEVRTLFKGSMWQAFHGGLLGLKYLVQAHKKHAQVLVPFFIGDILMAISLPNLEEDVLVLAADMLKHFAPFMENVKFEDITKAALLLWRSMELHKGAGLMSASIVEALSAWYNNPEIAKLLQISTEVQTATWLNLPLTVPMLHHHSQHVRASSATCVASIFAGGLLFSPSNSATFFKVFLPHLLLQLLFESDELVKRSLLSAWKQVIGSLSKEKLLMPLTSEQLPKWMTLLWSSYEIECLNVRITNSDDGIFDVDDRHNTDREMPKNSFSRDAFAEAIGFAAALVPPFSSCMTELVELIRNGLFSNSGERQCAALLSLSKWSYYEKQQNGKSLHEQSRRKWHLQDSIGSSLIAFAENHWRMVQLETYSKGKLFYSEQLGLLNRVKQMQDRIIDIFSSYGILLKPMGSLKLKSVSTADISRQIAEHVALFPYDELQDNPEAFKLAHFKRQDLFMVDELVQQSFSCYSHRIQGLGSSAYCELLLIPKRSGFLVKALMNSLKEENDMAFRMISARTIADFVVRQVHLQKKCVAKIIHNLCNSTSALVSVSYDRSMSICESGNFRRDCTMFTQPDVLKKTEARVAGAKAALSEICKCFGNNVFKSCQPLEDAISKAWKQQSVDELTIQRCMHLITVVVPNVNNDAMETCLSWLDPLAQLIQQPYQNQDMRCGVAHGIATICKYAKGQHRENAMLVVYTKIFVAFSFKSSATLKADALEAAVMVLDRIVFTLGAEISPYIPSLVHYAMKTMSSQFQQVRTFAAKTFAKLVPLIPLQMDLKLRDSNLLFSDSLRRIVEENTVSRTFLQSFTAGKAIQHTDVRSSLTPETSLRSYQQHGVDWLCFLANNNLHGILADDMGLGKTLQTLSAMASTLVVESKDGLANPCMIVCPPILVHHWMQEVKKYIPGVFASTVDYSVPSGDRKKRSCRDRFLSSTLGSSLILTTYSILRADVEFLSTIDFMYVVLDEAHLIRNPSTELFRAVLNLHASHRVALSGTPLQNNVTDLWALFEFIMPGYLGDFGSFRSEFVLPITKSKERNSTSAQKEQAAIAITTLHQKVLPFILRRTKDQVLKELPPKIISDVLLPLTSLQKRLYSLASTGNDAARSVKFSRTTVAKLHEPKVDTKNLTNVLTNLQLLRKICVHPALVADHIITQNLSSKEKEALWDWKSSGKMTGLHDILVDCCDIATRNQEKFQASAPIADDTNFSTHRCLVFAHLQKTLDLTEQMLLTALPEVTYRRLDGQFSLAKRADIVQHFNDDPSINVLLLTTSLGGLGLTLTGADTVIFLEHSWNPFVDIQAMDRAHRIGQKRTVRIFRLIMESSLEEHIVNLQEFKKQVATTVVQNSDAQSSMNANTKGVLSLLQASSTAVSAKDIRASFNKIDKNDKHVVPTLPQGAQELLDQIGELWDESQYKTLAFPEQE